jgi:hypothetical protein
MALAGSPLGAWAGSPLAAWAGSPLAALIIVVVIAWLTFMTRRTLTILALVPVLTFLTLELGRSLLVHGLQLLRAARDQWVVAAAVLTILLVARTDTIPGAGRIAPKLEVFLEKLLCRAAHAQIRPIAIEHMVAIEGDLTVMMTYRGAATTAAAAAASTARTMIAASHTFHVHQSVAALS